MDLPKTSPFEETPRTCVSAALWELCPDGWEPQDVRDAVCEAYPPNADGSVGVPRFASLEAAQALCMDVEEMWHEWGMTLAQFAREYPKGDFLVHVAGHALAIRDGQIIDPAWCGRRAARRRVQRTREVKNAGRRKMAAADRR